MKPRWALLAFLCSVPSVPRAEEVELRYEDLPRLVAEGNGDVRAARDFSAAARTGTGHLGRSFAPSVKLTAGEESFETGPYGTASQAYGSAEAELNLYRGGRDRLEERLRGAQVAASSAAARRTYLEDLTRSRRLHGRLVYDREAAAFLVEVAERNREILSSADRRVRRGLATETDRLEFELFGAQLREEIESLRHDVVLGEAELAPLLGKPVGTAFRTVEELPHVHDDPLLAAEPAAEDEPEVRSLRAHQESTALEGRAAGRAAAPSLDLYGGYHLYTRRERDFPRREDRDDRVGGIRLTWALFDGFRSRNQARVLAGRARAYGAQADHRMRTLDARERVLKEDLKHHHELLHSSEEQIALARKYLALTLAEYDRGVKNSPDALGALQRYSLVRRQYVERKRDYESVRAELLALLGL
jgi:outer membrane protein TolC